MKCFLFGFAGVAADSLVSLVGVVTLSWKAENVRCPTR